MGGGGVVVPTRVGVVGVSDKASLCNSRTEW